MQGMPPKDDEHCGAPRADSATPALDRRRFLSIAGSSAGLVLVAGAVPACGDPNEAPFGQVAAGNISALSLGAVMVIGKAVIARDADGVYAMTGVCTHMGCIVHDVAHVLANGLRCACHGSSYDSNGVVLGGPAPRPLQHYAVTIAADGSLTIEGDKPVSATTRTPVA